MKKILICILFLSYSISYAMHDDDTLNNALFVLTQKLNELHIVLSHQILPKTTLRGNFDEVIKNNQEFLKEFKKKFGKFKKQLTTFVRFLENTPESVQLKEPAGLKNLIKAKDALPTTKKINEMIESLNQFKDLSSYDINRIAQFLKDLKDFLNSIISHINDIADRNSDSFEQHTIDFSNKVKTADRHFKKNITSYFDSLEHGIDSVLTPAINHWTKRLVNV